MIPNPMNLFVRHIDVPSDLRGVTCYEPTEETDPTQVDLSLEGVEGIWRAVEALYRTGISPNNCW